MIKLTINITVTEIM